VTAHIGNKSETAQAICSNPSHISPLTTIRTNPRITRKSEDETN
jgi:hypothetical protein